MDKLEDLLTIEEVALKLKVSEFSVKQMIKKGLTTHKVGRLVKILEREAVAFITEGKACV